MIVNVIFKNDEKIKIEMTGKQLYDITAKNPERVAHGFYRGFHFYVLTMGSHPCAYVDVTETELNGKDYESIDIECHYGLTYSRKYLNTVDKKGWFIGWDYAHYNDFLTFNELLAKKYGEPYRAHKYTLTEIVKECANVIDQIIELLQG